MLQKFRSAALMIVLLMGMGLGDMALADPPDWAPAHGRRDRDRGDGDEHQQRPEQEREGRRFRGYDGRYYDRDYGIVERGRCNTDEILATAGAVAGGVIGNRSSAPENRTVATVIGAVIVPAWDIRWHWLQ